MLKNASQSPPSQTSKIRHIPLTLVLLCSCAFQLFYLFLLSDYSHHLYSDMAAYWQRAEARYQGQLFTIDQWAVWPPFFHIVLSDVFKILSFFKLYGFRLQAVLILFTLLSTWSTYAVYQITRQLTNRNWLSLAASVNYGFFFPLVYLNTFILSENLAIPALVTATYCAFQNFRLSRKTSAFLSGVFLAIAAACRPNLVVLALPFAIAFWGIPTFKRSHLQKSVIFALGICAILLPVIMENSYISKNQIRGLSANAGVNFFFQQCKVHDVVSTYYGGPFSFGHPAFVAFPEMGQFITNHPWHDQKFFFSLGIQCLREHPRIWLENFYAIRGLFLGPIFPFHPAAAGFLRGIPLFSLLALGMLANACFFLGVPNFSPWEFRSIAFLMSIVLTNALTFLFFPAEQRFSYPVFFAINTAFFGTLPYLRYYLRSMIIFGILAATFVFFVSTQQKARHDQQIKTFGYSVVREFPLTDAAHQIPEGDLWNRWGNFIIPDGSAILFRSPHFLHVKTMEISADNNDLYILDFYSGEKRVGTITIPAKLLPQGGLSIRKGTLPDSVSKLGFNAILVHGSGGDKLYSVGHLAFR